MEISPIVQDSADPVADARETAQRIAEGLAQGGPAGWRSMTAEFAVTTELTVGRVSFSDGEREVVIEAPEQVLDLVRSQREEVARSGEPPWWRLVLSATDPATVRIDYDYGEIPFPSGMMLPPQAYRADLKEYPRPHLPMWLAAYIGHDNRQTRSPRDAVAAARLTEGGMRPVSMDRELPPLPLLWVRWAVLSAAFMACGAEFGPRIQPSLGVFETARRSGATLYVLPGDRAVLSGGVWDAPSLDAVYTSGERMPDYFAGAPDWVCDQVMNMRAATGLLSFCYWWDDGHWYRAESPSAAESSGAVPGVWTAETVVDIVEGMLADAAHRPRIRALVAAAEQAAVTPDVVTAALGEDRDLDAAIYQLSLAGLVVRVVPARGSARSAVAGRG